MLVGKGTFADAMTQVQNKLNQLFSTTEATETQCKRNDYNIELIQDSLKSVDERIKHLTEDNSKLQKRVALLEQLRQRKESDEPWVELLGGDIDPDKGLEMNLDWNDAFINQLRSKGYKGATESSLVAQWLLTVSNTVKPEDDK